MKTTAHIFKTFPEFSKLTLADRDAYDMLIAKYPPISEVSFVALMTWWSVLDNCKVCLLNGNIVISYWLPGDENNSGLSLIGTNKIDESMCEIFDWLKSNGDECKLVHIPEFTLGKVRFPSMFQCEQELDYNEIILSVDNSAQEEKMPEFMKTKVKTFEKLTQNKQIKLKELDLSSIDNQDKILELYKLWKNRPHEVLVNKLPKHAENAFTMSIKNAQFVDLKCLCFYVDEQIHGFTIYDSAQGKDYRVLRYSGFSCEVVGLYEFACLQIAKRFKEQEALWINMAIHIGDPRYSAHRLALNPVNDFKKYTVRPVEASM